MDPERLHEGLPPEFLRATPSKGGSYGRAAKWIRRRQYLLRSLLAGQRGHDRNIDGGGVVAKFDV